MNGPARALLCGALLLLTAACSTGRQFALPPAGSLTLGKTTAAEVTARLGEPMARSSTTLAQADQSVTPKTVFEAAPQPGTYDLYRYYYVDLTGQIWVGRLAGERPIRSLSLAFWNGTLIAYVASSSFDGESTDFDDSKIAQLVRDKTTGDEVLALFGKPSGGAVYPAISRRDGARMSYSFARDDMTNAQTHTKRLFVFVDSAGIVRDFEASSATDPTPANRVFTGFLPMTMPRAR